MADDHGRGRIAADEQRFFDGGFDRIAFVTQMRGVDRAVGTQAAREFDDFVGAGVFARHVPKPGREAGGALFQRLVEPRFHARDFSRCCRARGIAAHCFAAQRHMPDQRIRVDRGRLRREPFGIGGEAVERPPALVAEQIERRGRPAIECDRREADAAIADDDRGDSLRELAQHARRAFEDRAVVVGMRVDKARREREAFGIDLFARRQAGEIADRRHALAVDGDIGRECRFAGAVDDLGAADDQVGHGLTPDGRR